MRIEGGGSVKEWGPEDEGPHTIGGHEFWQESVVLVWWDLDNSVGGVHRIGHEPNAKDGPQISLWNHAFSPEWIYKRAVTLPLREADRPENGFNGGDDTCKFTYTDHGVWTFDDEDLEGELHIADAHTPVDIYPKSGGSLSDDFAPNHMEVGGKCTGKLRIKDKTYEINGLAFRDHGWGIRKWDAIVSHRWVAGTFDDGTTLLAVSFHGADDQLAKFGCVLRGDTLTYTRDLDILTYMEVDGLTHRGGTVRMTLPTGEVLDMICEPLQKGAVSWIHGISCVDTMCKITLGDRVGICDFETTNNALRGGHRPLVAVNGIEEDGLHRG
ncbi:MAG: hypothetical protein OXC05_06920 [Halieaceae bacterium]|nr:hypothetical protein [Halieaceae bacterium]